LSFDPSRLVLPHIAAMEPYTPILPFEVLRAELGRAPEQIVKLDANENPYGPHPAVRVALAEYPFPHIYPDPEHRQLRAALAEYAGAPAEHILPGHGADELIDLLTRITVGPGDAIIDCPPTFGMYSFDAGLTGARVIRVSRGSDFSVDVAGVEAAVAASGAKLLFLTSPNNPDGSLLPRADLERLLELPLLLVLDEAYVEFAGLAHSVSAWAAARENLIVLRTFSKWAGIAGLRLGYGIFPGWLMPVLWKAKQPYNVNVAATVAGLASLAHRDEIQATVDALIAERERIYRELAAFPCLHPHPSAANFVLARVEGYDARELKAALAQDGVLVRYYAKPGLENCIRVSAGRPADTDALLAALSKRLQVAPASLAFD
jgi:histidinol-phosphate aminotransferase